MQENKPEQLASQVKTLLLKEIQSGKYQSAHRLPPETQLAADMNVSRTAIRDALSVMEQDGYISRRRGTGTIINRHVLNVAVRFDGEKEFLKIVENGGYTPDIRFLSAAVVPADERIAGHLSVAVGSQIITAGRIVTADGTPLIYCTDYIPLHLLKKQDYTEEDLKKPIFDFLRNFCGTEGCMDLTGIHARNADGNVAALLEVPVGTAVLNFDEVWYDFDGTPILYADEYYREGMITHTILRKRQEKY